MNKATDREKEELSDRCVQCNRRMNPVDFYINPVCLKCCKKNHRRVSK